MKSLVRAQSLQYPFFTAEDSESAARLTPEGSVLRETPFNRGNELGRFIGAGTFGVVFELGDGFFVIKIEKTPSTSSRLNYSMALNRWASENAIGPKFDSWGKLELPQESFGIMRSIIGDKSPDWLKKPAEGDTYVYSVFEKWADGTLYDYVADTTTASSTDRMKSIPKAMVLKLKQSIRKLHDRNVVHLDLTLKNILVRLDTGNIVDLAISDFGSAIPREAWFFKTTKEFRASTVKHFSEFSWVQTLALMFNKKHPGNFQKWLLVEPYNFDWCVLYTCAAYMRFDLVLEPLKRAHELYFDFTIPFRRDGWIVAKITNGSVVVEKQIYGLMSATDVRKVLKQSHPDFQYRTVFETVFRTLLPWNRESTTFVSALLHPQVNGSYMIRLKPVKPNEISISAQQE
jgi:serine/threonine protein kinase